MNTNAGKALRWHVFVRRSIVQMLFLLVVLLVPRASFAAFGTPSLFNVGSNPRSVFASDLNSDGKADLATANYGSHTVSVLLGNGDGTFIPSSNYSVGSNPANVFAADLDNDGDRDLAVGNFSSDNVSILLNNGNGTFAAAVNYASGDGAWSVFAIDLDGDGDRDLAVTNSNAATVSVLIGNGDGTFATAVTYPVQTVPASVHAIDFDGDGDSDLAVANYFGATVSILKNNGNGTFAAAVHYEVGNWAASLFNYPIFLYAADLDNDGDADIATANYDNNQVSVLLNAGNGTFGASMEYAVGSRPPSIFIADMDSDGDRDLVTANYFGGTVSVLSNNGNGTFATTVDYNAGSGPWSVYAADLDRDNDLDLAVANYDSAKVAILLSDINLPPAPGPAIAPIIHIGKKSEPPSLPDGPGPVTFTYRVSNNGQVTMTDISVTDNQCDQVTFVSGDANDNAWLETNEVWIYQCTMTLSETTINFAKARGVANDLESVDTAVIEVVVAEPVAAPLIHVHIAPEPASLSVGGGSVTYAYHVHNPGTIPLSDVFVEGDACAPVVYTDGDLNGNKLLDTDELWTYECTVTILKTTISTAVATGDGNGRTAIDPASSLVIVADLPMPVSEPYGTAEALAGSPTINADKKLVLPVGGLPVSCSSGILIKIEDDGNPSTREDAAVYYCGADGKRYVFPDEGTYFSWYPNFSGVVVISASQLQSIPIGGNVTYRPGTRLVKISSDPKVYAVAKGGVLRWVVDEVTARTLYGLDWGKWVSDIPESMFVNYTLGSSITLAEAIPGTAAVPAPSVCLSATTFTHFLSLGSVDSEVRPLQELLKCLGYFPSNVAPSGYFGPITEDAVKKFQAANGIDPVGYVGPATREALNRY